MASKESIIPIKTADTAYGTLTFFIKKCKNRLFEQNALIKFPKLQLEAFVNWPFFCGLVVEELRWTRDDNVCGFVAEWVITLLLTASLFSLAGRDVVVAEVPVDGAGWTRSERLLPGSDGSLGNSSCCMHSIVTQHDVCHNQLHQQRSANSRVQRNKILKF